MAMPRNAQAQRYATQLVGFRPEGIASEYNSTSGTVINPNFVRGLSGSVELAVMGNTLFVSTFNDGTVGAYDASSGTAINAKFITGLNEPTGIAVAGNLLFVASFGSQFGAGFVGQYEATSGA